MFGYVRIDKPELRVREYEAYRASYCGLCRSMGKCTGCASRMTLSYDFAFLFIFRTVLTGAKVESEARRCFVHPFTKRPMLKASEESEYAACAAALLTYYKCKDDLADETGKKRRRARAVFSVAKRMRRRALKRLPVLTELDASVAASMEKIREAEHERIPSADRYAELSGGLLGEIFAFGLSESDAKIARSFGRHVGKWIYLVDACDDLDEDLKAGRFNPYALLWGLTEDGKNSDGRWEERREMLRVALLSELSEAEKSMDLLDFYDYADFDGVLRNILYRGMPHTAERVLSGTEKEKEKKRERQKGNG